MNQILLVRILGNDVPDLHHENQTLKNLKFTLKYEKEYKFIDKLFVLNRLYDENKRRDIIQLLQEFNQKYIEIPFTKDEFAEIISSCPSIKSKYHVLESSFRETSHIKAKQLFNTEINADESKCLEQINFYVVNNNGARNFALEYGRKHEYAWIYAFDSNSFVDEDLANEMFASLHDVDIKYIIVPQKRLKDRGQVNEIMIQNPSVIDDYPKREPQIAFHISTKTTYNERIPYGSAPKAELLFALDVPGPWKKWGEDICIKKRISCRKINEPWKWMSRVVRLQSHTKKSSDNNVLYRKTGMLSYIKNICFLFKI